MTRLAIVGGGRMAERFRNGRRKPTLLMTGGALGRGFLKLTMKMAFFAVERFVRPG